MFCAKCGARLEEHAKFCNKCGNPVSASADGGQTAGAAKKQGKGPLAAVVILAVVLVAGAGIFGYQATHKKDADIQEAAETVDVAVEEVQPQTEAEEQRDEKAELLAVLENISYYGDKSQCAMTAEQATAYAQLIADGLAGDFSFRGGYDENLFTITSWKSLFQVFDYVLGSQVEVDRFHVMLCDFSGDGVPYLYVFSSTNTNDDGNQSFEIYGWTDDKVQLVYDTDANKSERNYFCLYEDEESPYGIMMDYVEYVPPEVFYKIHKYAFLEGTIKTIREWTEEENLEDNLWHIVENNVETVYTDEEYAALTEYSAFMSGQNAAENHNHSLPYTCFYELQPSTLSDMMEGLNQYAACIVGEDGEENGDDTDDSAAVDREAVLEQYRQFLQGNLTVEYKGNQVNLNEFYEAVLKEDGLESFYDFSDPGMGAYALTDVDMNGLPELQVAPSITEYWWIFMIEPVDGKLKMIERSSVSGSWGILYSNGLIQSGDGMHTSGHYDWFTNLQDEQIACFTYFYDEEGYEASESFIEEQIEATYQEGYEQVYITHGKENGSARDEYDRMVSDFAAEHGGKEVSFYSLEEILNMMPAPDTTAESAQEAAASPWLIKMKNCIIDVDLSACVPARYLEAIQRDIYNDALQKTVSSLYRHPEMITITQASMYDETMILFHIDNSDCDFIFITEDGGNNWEYYCFNNERGTDYGVIIIFDNGVPDNADDLYSECTWGENAVDFNGEIWRTDYQMGDPVLSLRDAEGNTVKIPIS